MPLFGYKCKKGHTTDELFKYPPPDSIKCATTSCRCKASRTVSMPAKTAGRWGNGGNINGTYCRSLGKSFSNNTERDTYAADNGFICSNDLASGQMDQVVHASIKESEQNELDTNKYKDILAKTGDKTMAVAETFSVERMKANGVLDDEARG